MNFIVILLAFATFISTLVGGIVAIKLRKVLQYFFAFAAGSLVAVALLDILPESINTAQSVNVPLRFVMIAVVISFFFYSIIEKMFATHHFHGNEHDTHGHILGPIGAGGLVIHSFLDGVAIGAAFQLNAAIGVIVAIAVISHDFTDGINTVTLMLKNKHSPKKAAIFLGMDALAPVLGVFATSLTAINASFLSILLAIFAGEFIYIGASNLLPETPKNTPWKMVLFMGL